MSILSSLVRAYERLEDAPPFGYSFQNIGFVISLRENGTVAGIHDWRQLDGKKLRPRAMLVPQPVKRTAGIAPNFLWDKTSYVLGITAGDGKRTADEHRAFVDRHIKAIGETDDAGLRALVLFLQGWRPDHFQPPLWPEEMRDENVMFALETERRDRFLHERPAARALWSRETAPADAKGEICLVTGERGPIARLHPSIKGVWGAQSSGAALVSFNLEAFSSYGHEQGANAPVSETAAAAYTAALNRFLERDSRNRIQIGDASTVFWADASDIELPAEAEAYGWAILAEEKIASEKIASNLARIVAGASLDEVEPRLSKGVNFYVLGLAPNAARISVRFFWQGSFGELTANYRSYVRDLAFTPWPADKTTPRIRQCIPRLGKARVDRNNKVTFDTDQVPDQYAGEFMRAVITGGAYPSGLLGHLLMRIRSDRFLDSVRIAMIKAILVRDARLHGRLPPRPNGTPDEDYLMKADPDDPSIARKLGRIFALMERIQSASLGEQTNATIKDRFLSAAAATPQQVFVGLMTLSEAHLSRLRRGHSDAEWVAKSATAAHISTGEMAKRLSHSFGRQLGTLIASLPSGFPAQHAAQEQGLFMIGYYQERFGRKGDGIEPDDPQADEDVTSEDHGE